MKKILFGSASAILAVVGFSAFKTSNQATTLKQYEVVPEVAIATHPELAVGTQLAPAAGVTCESGSTNYCIVTILTTSVTTSDGITKVSSLTKPQSTFTPRP